jgi:outer membrane receptor protein involved in Fe transport
METYNQKLQSLGTSGDTISLNTTVTDFLPSLNFIYELTEKTNIRLAYFKSVARPEFRELAPFNFYDFNLNTVIVGNTTLQRTTIDNYDFRTEYFLGEGQLLSFSLFYKKFTNAIEPVFFLVGGGSYSMGYNSNTNAVNKGFEIEVRKNLSEADKWLGTKFMKNFLFNANYAYISSEVDLSNISATQTNKEAAKRPLQGQSNYLLNMGLSYNDPVTDISAGVLYNKIGRRIFAVQEISGSFPSIWENPRDIIDLSVSKRFFKKLDVKLTLGDILAQDLIFYQDNNKNGKVESKNNDEKRAELIRRKKAATTQQEIDAANNEMIALDNIIYRFKMGRTVSIGVSYKF